MAGDPAERTTAKVRSLTLNRLHCLRSTDSRWLAMRSDRSFFDSMIIMHHLCEDNSIRAV